MGQYWKFVNIDKLQSLEPTCGRKMGEFFFGSNHRLLRCLITPSVTIDSSVTSVIGNWAGDRIICLGDSARTLPSGVITEDDTKLLQELLESDEDQNQDGAASRLGGRFYYGTTSINETIYKSSYRYPVGLFLPNAVWTLRNISKKEFIRSDKISEPSESNHKANRHDAFRDAPGLFQALIMRTGWSADPSCAMSYNEEQYDLPIGMKRTLLNEGAWAGNRLDLVILTDEGAQLAEEGWSDVSDEAASQLKDILSS